MTGIFRLASSWEEKRRKTDTQEKTIVWGGEKWRSVGRDELPAREEP